MSAVLPPVRTGPPRLLEGERLVRREDGEDLGTSRSPAGGCADQPSRRSIRATADASCGVSSSAISRVV
ncbi:hypothetical protein SFUMM280S_03662 [Streptomyces fumanus]